MADRRIGRFRILAPLGKGGMATVWRAEDELLGHTVALKVLADDLSGSARARRRFRHEAEIATRLDHVAIVPVYSHGEDGGVTWMAMRLIEGESVAARIARSLVPVDESLRVAQSVAEALDYAHSQSVVHRDVTANNVMIANDGRVFVMDFGLARAEGISHITSTGVAMGTLGYLAPEVLAGGDADVRSDIYGLGVVLYEMLTGSMPFVGDRRESVSYRAANEDPVPPSWHRAGLEPALDALVLTAISRDPARRYADAGRFASALAEMRDRRSVPMFDVGTIPEHVGALARALDSSGALYLAVAAFGYESEALAPLAATLRVALLARLPGPGRLHVVEAQPPADPAAWREFAQAAGVNAVLAGRLRESGSRLRLELWLADPDAGTRLAGGHVDGHPFDPFALEDDAVQRAAALLGISNDLTMVATQPMRRDPAADEHFARALRYLERHDHEASVDGAIALLESLVTSAAPKAEWFAGLARACLMKYDLTRQRGWEGRAAEACTRARSMAPDSPDVVLAWADLMSMAGRDPDALAGYERVLGADPRRVDAWLGLVILHGQAGRTREAEDAARRAIEVSPRDWRAHNALGRDWLRFGQFAEAVAPLQRAAELSPDNARVRRNLAIALAQSDRLEEAVELLREVVALEPSDSAYANLGAALFALGDRAGALDALERATRLAPADARRWGNYASALRFEPGRELEATGAFDRAIALMQDQLARNPGEPDLWARLADWLQARGRAAEADDALARALEIAPENVDCMVHAAFVKHQRGDRNGTLEWLGRALAHGYGREVLKRSAEFSDLREDPEFRSMLEQAAVHREAGTTTHGGARQEERT